MASNQYTIGQILAGGSVSTIEKGEYIANPTNEDKLLYGGYSTVANGQADDIVVPAGMGLRRLTNGDAHDFATYQVVSLEKAQEKSR